MPALVTIGPSIVTSSLFGLVFLWFSVALGGRLVRWLGVTDRSVTLEWFVIAAGLGAGTLQLLPLGLGAMAALRVGYLRAALGVLALVLAADLRSTLLIAWRARKAVSELSRVQLACLAVLCPALLTAAFLAFTPTVDPDGLGYHLTVPKRWLESGSLVYLPTYPYSNTPMGVEMLFTIALSLIGDAGAKTVHLLLGLLAALSLYLAGRRLRSSFTGALAATLFLVGPIGVVGLLGCAYLEGATSFAMAAATLSWIIWFERRSELGWLRAAFALAGIAASFKLTAVLFPLALGALTIAVFVEPKTRAGAPLLRVIAPVWQIGILAALPVLPWLVRSALVTGNPIFPILASRIPSRDLSPALAKQFEDYNRYMLWATRFGANWSLEQRKLVLLGVGVMTLLSAGIVCAALRSYTARALTLVIAGTVLVQLAAVGLYVRYWLPTLAILALLALVALPSLRVLSSRAKRWLFLGAAAVASLYQARVALAGVDQDVAGLVKTALGAESQRTFLLRHLPLYPLYERANQLSPDAKILLSTYCGGFYLDRTTYCAEFVQDALRLTAWEAFMTDVRRLGTSYVIAPTRLQQAVAAGEFATQKPLALGQGSVSEVYRAQQNEFVGRLLNEHGQLLATASDQSLYAVQLGTDTGTPP